MSQNGVLSGRIFGVFSRSLSELFAGCAGFSMLYSNNTLGGKDAYDAQEQGSDLNGGFAQEIRGNGTVIGGAARGV